jgi:hypothetical protein
MLRRVGIGREPDTAHVFSRLPLSVGLAQPDNCPALLSDQIVSGNTDCPSEPGRLRHDLIGGVDRLGSANSRDCFHLPHRSEQLHCYANAA